MRTGDAETGIGKIFDADKVQKEINAQVQITQTFGQQASRAVGDYAQIQRNALHERAKSATAAEEKEIQTQLNDLSTQERVMNVLIGAVSGMGGTALTKETLSAAADEMRQIMIEDSKKFKGITDGTAPLSNLSGKSEGVRGDGTKIGGTRVDLDGVCGQSNERCKKQVDGEGKFILDEKDIPKLLLNGDGMAQFDYEIDGKKISLADFLNTREGQKMAGLTGGIQGAEGTLFGIPYAAGSWQDKLIEAFGGTHDVIGGQAVGLYDEQGNIQRGMTEIETKAYDVWSGAAIAPATPFAAATLLPPEAWKAISILLEASK